MDIMTLLPTNIKLSFVAGAIGGFARFLWDLKHADEPITISFILTRFFFDIIFGGFGAAVVIPLVNPADITRQIIFSVLAGFYGEPLLEGSAKTFYTQVRNHRFYIKRGSEKIQQYTQKSPFKKPPTSNGE